jgi:DNA ligase-associated metallophosphoesterase
LTIVHIKGEELQLSSEKAFFWQAQQMLVISDIHLGKAGHFRKHGIPISMEVHMHDLERIENLIESFRPKQVVFLGDLFHSDLNDEWWVFEDWITRHPTVKFVLIKGNHDILPDQIIRSAGLVVTDRLELGPFSFTHIQEEDDYYNFSGHIHPGFRVRGFAKQSVTLPCFLFRADSAIVPAFGNFTGLAKIKASKHDKLYVVADTEVIQINPESI